MTFINWNRNFVSIICGVTWCIFVHDLPYHNKWICYKLRQALDIFCKFYMLSITSSITLLRFLYQNFFKVGSIRRRACLTFLLVFCAFGYLAFLLLVLDTLLILWNVKRGSCFATTFHCCLLRMSCCILQCFSSLKVFLTLIIVMTKAIACMVVFSCLYPSWSIFYPRFNWLSGLRSSAYFAANIVKRSDDLTYQLHFVFPSLKLFYICNEAVWFWEQSNL